MFKKVKIKGSLRDTQDFWAVFLVNAYNEKDCYKVTASLDSEAEADNLVREFNRIIRESK